MHHQQFLRSLLLPLSHTNMLFSFLVTALFVLQAVSLPTPDSSEDGALILVLELENLEVAFYKRGLSLFNQSHFAAANFSDLVFLRYQEILRHEEVHARVLTHLLGERAPEPCNYSLYVFFYFQRGFRKGRLTIFALNSPFDTVESFVDLSLLFEGVGEFIIFVWTYI
jgi:Ferritin-like domain